MLHFHRETLIKITDMEGIEMSSDGFDNREGLRCRSTGLEEVLFRDRRASDTVGLIVCHCGDGRGIPSSRFFMRIQE
jgi:hypothetical protein